jgi:hypothetical protein
MKKNTRNEAIDKMNDLRTKARKRFDGFISATKDLVDFYNNVDFFDSEQEKEVNEQIAIAKDLLNYLKETRKSPILQPVKPKNLKLNETLELIKNEVFIEKKKNNET